MYTSLLYKYCMFIARYKFFFSSSYLLAVKYVMKCHMYCTEGLMFQLVSLRSSDLLLLTLKKNPVFCPPNEFMGFSVVQPVFHSIHQQ